jgi:Tol biopolymer transport system component
MSAHRLLPLAAAIVLTSAPSLAAPLPADPEACFRAVTHVLADDAMEGRGTGSPGNDRAAQAIAAWMDEIGLAAPQQGRMQPFEANTGIRVGEHNVLEGAGYGTDWIPLGFSKSAAFAGDLVFAGYGIRAKDLGYDDYAGIDVRGKVVLALRFEPGENDDKSPFDGKKPTRYSDLRAKAILAREAGAAALILVSPPQTSDEPDKLPPLKTMGPLSDAGIPVLQVTRAQADRWLAASGSTLLKAQAAIDTGFKPASFALKDARASGRVDLHPVIAKTQNVVGLLPGAGALAQEWVVVGAHFDHLGFGGQGSFKPDVRAIHNGADDNASGVAGILCAARVLAEQESRSGDRSHNRRSLMFVGFSAEEIGLGGSAWFVEHLPAGKIGDVAAMINLDMVGRMNEHKLNILGADSSSGWDALVEAANKVAPEVKISAGGDGYGPSDHSSFYASGVPVVHLFTGAHEQYHSPEDDASLLNLEGGAHVARITAALADGARVGARLDYVRTSAAAPTAGDSRGYGAYFGSVPDYSAMEATTGGVKLSDVRPNSPAEKGGVRKGDVIIGMAGITINNLYDMTFVLREHKPGDTIDIVVKRDGKELKLRATLSQRPGEAAPAAHPPAGAAATAPVKHASFEVGADPARGGEWQPRAGKAVPELMRADEPHLADLRRLTFGGDNAEAYWSPDGRKLSFQRTPRGGDCDAQYVLDLDSGKVELVSSGQGRTTCGYFDYPQGDSLIYATTEAAGPSCPPKPDYSQGYVWAIYDSFDIVRRDAAGKTTPLIGGPGYDAEATECFKDGRILFTSTRDGDLDLYVADRDGGHVKQLTSLPGYDGGAFFTPDCSKIVWRASRPEGGDLADYQRLLADDLVRPSKLEIYVMDADGGNVKQLTRHGVGSFAPYPTPDGKGVIYATNVGANAREFDLRIVRFDGGDERITTAPSFDGFPMFSPDGRWLVFASNRANKEGERDTDLYLARWKP